MIFVSCSNKEENKGEKSLQRP